MLKELVDLIAVAQEAWSHCSNGDATNICEGPLGIAIKAAKEAVARYGDEKRKTDEAICLLFRAVELADTHYEGAIVLVERAERLLGFAQLEKAGDA